MVSDFCSPDLGWLKSKDGKEEVCVLFKSGKNQDGYFGNDDLIKQTKHTNFAGTTTIAAFAFDNATTHQKQADDGLSACHMPKFPKHWYGKSGKCRMCNGVLPNGQPQSLYFLDDHPTKLGEFKGMEIILRECGLLKESKLRAQCPQFKYVDLQAACCCRRVLFNCNRYILLYHIISIYVILCTYMRSIFSVDIICVHNGLYLACRHIRCWHTYLFTLHRCTTYSNKAEFS
ncbi:hypothetical protein M422DRAFT_163090 [Sphaerobolus stellatus SS14]|uniref:Uncharacterized protein n=1 Tax=Sphaerobolus stellatus (strain SS14) TaxID=990650 RepID=A0A0C9UWH1_SPHS4|nr:hypothetical protein M422DRAFT_163090 [Sphaerobolus stellatus SS14]